MNPESSLELSMATWRANGPQDEPYFDEQWPTETMGDGKVRPNNFRTGAAQGKSSLVRKAPCQLCGFINDLTSIDHSGGSIDGNGAGGAIANTTASVATSAPNDLAGHTYTHTEKAGTQAFRKAAGCALCFSKNSTPMRQDMTNFVSPYDRLRLTGF